MRAAGWSVRAAGWPTLTTPMIVSDRPDQQGDADHGDRQRDDNGKDLHGVLLLVGGWHVSRSNRPAWREPMVAAPSASVPGGCDNKSYLSVTSSLAVRVGAVQARQRGHATAAGPRGPDRRRAASTGGRARDQFTDTADQAALTAATCAEPAPNRSVAALSVATRAPA